MLPRRLLAARPLTRAPKPTITSRAFSRTPVSRAEEVVETDAGMNGGYINPPAIKRQHRDPYAKYWDQQDRRDYGEPVHEDNDVLGMFTTEDYSHFTPGWAAVLLGTFIASVFGLAGVVRYIYPDKIAAPRTFPGGLERELGGPKTVRARKEGEGWK